MRIVLLGDSHLARVRRDLAQVGDDVVNAARGGATVTDLDSQAADVGLDPADVCLVSVGTNDAAPRHGVDVADFHRVLDGFVVSHSGGRVVVMAPPGVDEGRLGPGDRTNAQLDRFRDACVEVARSHTARLLDTPSLIAPLGTAAFASDGLHLSGTAYGVLLPALAQRCRED